MRNLKNVLFDRLEEKGIELNAIPGFIRSLVRSVGMDPQMSLTQIEKQLHYLGWDEFDLDYHTLQLAIACFEAEGMDHLAYKSAHWFEKAFKPSAY